MISEEINNQIQDTLTHKKLVIDSGYKMCNYLFKKNKDKLAFELLNRIIVHDNSKFTHDELYGLASIRNRKALMNPDVLLSKEQQKIVEIHWKNNRHHPEYFKNIEDMTDVDIMEMCCDWHARSIQYGTDLMEFVNIRQENRFHFPEHIFKKILKYCSILLAK